MEILRQDSGVAATAVGEAGHSRRSTVLFSSDENLEERARTLRKVLDWTRGRELELKVVGGSSDEKAAYDVGFGETRRRLVVVGPIAERASANERDVVDASAVDDRTLLIFYNETIGAGLTLEELTANRASAAWDDAEFSLLLDEEGRIAAGARVCIEVASAGAPYGYGWTLGVATHARRTGFDAMLRVHQAVVERLQRCGADRLYLALDKSEARDKALLRRITSLIGFHPVVEFALLHRYSV